MPQSSTAPAPPPPSCGCGDHAQALSCRHCLLLSPHEFILFSLAELGTAGVCPPSSDPGASASANPSPLLSLGLSQGLVHVRRGLCYCYSHSPGFSHSLTLAVLGQLLPKLDVFPVLVGTSAVFCSLLVHSHGRISPQTGVISPAISFCSPFRRGDRAFLLFRG